MSIGKIFSCDLEGVIKKKIKQDTLISVPGSKLADMFLDESQLKFQEDGSIFIDRNHIYFGLVIDYLRDGMENFDIPGTKCFACII